MTYQHLNEWWQSCSLARRFLMAGGVVTLTTMVLVGWLVTTLITSSVTRNAAATTALYVDSVIAPLLPDLQTSIVLSDGVSRALDETLDMGALGGRLAAFKLWRRDGTILYSTNHSEIGHRLGPSDDLLMAWSGQVVAQYVSASPIAYGFGLDVFRNRQGMSSSIWLCGWPLMMASRVSAR